jgi:archaellum component FlaC
MLVSIVVGVWVYMLVLNLGNDFNGMSAQMGQMHGYMKNMAAGEPVEGQDSYMSSMAHDIRRMSDDISIMRTEMKQVSEDIGVMRTAMSGMRDDIGSMNGSIVAMGGDMKDMRNNIDGMAQSLSHMGRNVGRLSRDARQLRDPFGGMMPW